MQALKALLTLVVLVGALTASATASAPPVGPLPPGPVTQITVHYGELFAIALAKPKGAGRVWRVARAYNGKVVNEVSEGVQRGNVVVVYRALRAGKAAIVYAVTIGERTKALQARTFRVTVR
ncbi:MAG TPA: hypothetical protein VFW85_10600 [Gaiellaceae bacterium]|nr:hypothetical protein [Gaiellaceae bacterium]